jgi:hypothetical protein
MRNKQQGKRPLGRTPIAVFLALVVAFVGACQPKESVDDTLRALDLAQVRLTTESANWRDVLEELEPKLKDNVRDALQQVQDVAARAAAAVATNVQCTVDFLGERMNDFVGGQVRDAIARIRAHVAGQKYEKKVKPAICTMTPSTVSLPSPGQTLATNAIEIFGYNFDSNPQIELRLSGKRGQSLHPKALTKQSHYHMTILMTDDPQAAREDVLLLDKDSELVSLLWDGGSMSDIPVAPPVIPICGLDPFRTQVQVHDYTPPHVQGDMEFGFNAPRITVAVSLINYGSHIDVQITMIAQESNGGDTLAKGTTTRRAYTAPAGKRINAVITPTIDTGLSYTDIRWEAYIENRGEAALVQRYESYGNRRGNDTDGWTRVQVRLNPIQVQLIETQGCRLP